jgi:hypothetical protein
MTWGGENSFSGTSCIGGDDGVRDDFSMEAASCPADVLRVKTHDAPIQSASRIGVRTIVADFTSAGVEFKARLFLPTGGKSLPLLVLPAARDGWSRLDWDHAPYLASGLGLAVFVYDKPGKWPDGLGKIRTDDEALRHAAAAMAKAKASAGGRVLKVGFFGGEDALLAASGTNADFAVVDAEKLPTRLLQRKRMPVLWFLPSQGDRRAEAVAQDEIRKLGLGDYVNLVVMPGADEHLAFYEQRGSEQCHVDSPRAYWPTIQRWLGALSESLPPKGQ